MRNLKYLITVLAVLFLTPITLALSYDASSNGTANQSGYTFTANGTLGTKTFAGYTALGVADGYAGSEIEAQEWLRVDFDNPQSVDYITIAFLYNGFEFGDAYEKANISNGSESYTLTSVGNTIARWNGNGSVVNVSPATWDGGGVWTISNPFSGPVDSITFSAVNMFRYTQSDFGLEGFGTHGLQNPQRVPDGGTTLAFLGLALMGFPLLRRR